MLQILHLSRSLTVIFALGSLAFATDFHPPVGDRYAQIAASTTILPGGRLLKPAGVQIETGPGPFGLAISAKGTIATADTGYERFGVTIIEPPGKTGLWRAHQIWARTPHSTTPEIADPDWKGVTPGIAFDSAKSLWVSEGYSGRLRQIDIDTGDRRKIINLNSPEWHDSFTADLAFDGSRRLLYAVDQSNKRLAVIDAKSGRVLSSIRVPGRPFAIALSPDAATAYLTDSNSVCAIDTRDPLKPRITDRIRTGSPESVLAAADRIFVSNALDDSITVISARDRKVISEIPLAVPSLEQFRGVIPAGLAYDPVTKWLLVAEAGINAIGVVDTEKNQVIGHIPAGWMPVRVAMSGDRVYVTNAGGRGAGPSLRRALAELGEAPVLHRGSVTTFIMPDASEILRQTGAVFSLNGFVPYMRDPPKPPAAIRHVVLILKQNRSFDEILGDIALTPAALPALARFGMRGRAFGGRTQFSVKDAPITPNQHEIARRWGFSDNFYADGETRAEGEMWLNGGYPDPVTARVKAPRVTTETGRLWDHLRRGGINFQNFDEGGDNSDQPSDQQRADRFIAGIDRRYRKTGEPLPAFIRISLPADRIGEPKPQTAYPFDSSFVADNDLATGRILEYLSHSPWWRDMAVFITETDTQGSLDHIDAHRTLLLAAGPWVKRNYVSHTNASFPGLLRTIFELLGLPPLNLMDATAASLRDMFTAEPDYAPFTALHPDGRIFDPASPR